MPRNNFAVQLRLSEKSCLVTRPKLTQDPLDLARFKPSCNKLRSPTKKHLPNISETTDF